MKPRNMLSALGALGVVILLGSCADAERPFSVDEEEPTFTVEVEAKASTSVRTEGTNVFWFSGTSASFSTDFVLHDQGGHSMDGGDTPPPIGSAEANGYDIQLQFLSPQHIHWWNPDMNMWHEEEPHTTHDRYLMVRQDVIQSGGGFQRQGGTSANRIPLNG